jgi:hypothetical protein
MLLSLVVQLLSPEFDSKEKEDSCQLVQERSENWGIEGIGSKTT